jgi:toxin ParE1/3/4
MRVRWTDDAAADLRQISARIENDRSRTLANRICRAIYSAVQSLRRHPAKGRPGRVSGTRELVIPGTPYVVMYRLGPASIGSPGTGTGFSRMCR